MKTLTTLMLVALAIGLASCSAGTNHQANTTGTPTPVPTLQHGASASGANATNPQTNGNTEVAQGISVNESDYRAHGNYSPDAIIRPEFAQLLTNPKPYHVTLVGQRTVGGVTTTSVQQWYVDGSNLRLDTGNQHAIKLGNRTFVCVNATNWSCSEQPFRFYTGVEADIRAHPLANEVTKLSSSPIGGTTTSCYKVAHGTTNATFCLTNTGIPTMIDIESPNGTASKFVASGRSTDVPSGAFTLPALPSK